MPPRSRGNLNLRSAYFLAYKRAACEFLLHDEIATRLIEGRPVVSANFITPYPPGFPSADSRSWRRSSSPSCWRCRALVSYAIGIAIQIPFLAQRLYTGPLVEHLGGADISWLVGLLGTAVIYYLWARKTMNPPAQMIYPADAEIQTGPIAGDASEVGHG